MIVNTISGFSAKLRKGRRKTLSDLVDVALGDPDWPGRPRAVFRRDYYSSDDHCVEDSVRFVQTTPGNKILLVGKSLGAVRTWWLMTRYWQNIRGRLGVDSGAKVGVVLIDPHGCQYGDGRVGSYGVRLKRLPWMHEWDDDRVNFKVVYQKNRYPKGVPMSKNGPLNRRLPKGATHWNITDPGTAPGQDAMKAIRDMVDWLNE